MKKKYLWGGGDVSSSNGVKKKKIIKEKIELWLLSFKRS